MANWFRNKSMKSYLAEIKNQSLTETRTFTVNEIYHDEHLKPEQKKKLLDTIRKKFNLEDYEL
jgi:hypothetical protein